jgi:hypothetical protein
MNAQTPTEAGAHATEAQATTRRRPVQEFQDAEIAYLRRRQPGYKYRLLAMSPSEIEAAGGMGWWLEELKQVEWMRDRGLI